jgi:hypothetical protein
MQSRKLPSALGGRQALAVIPGARQREPGIQKTAAR